MSYANNKINCFFFVFNIDHLFYFSSIKKMDIGNEESFVLLADDVSSQADLRPEESDHPVPRDGANPLIPLSSPKPSLDLQLPEANSASSLRAPNPESASAPATSSSSSSSSSCVGPTVGPHEGSGGAVSTERAAPASPGSATVSESDDDRPRLEDSASSFFTSWFILFNLATLFLVKYSKLKVKTSSGWLLLEPEAGQNVIVGSRRFILVLCMIVTRSYRVWLHSNDECFTALARDVTDVMALSGNERHDALNHRLKVVPFAILDS
jgi:hypothetical protein